MKNINFTLVTFFCFFTIAITAFPLTSIEIKDSYEWNGHVRIEGKEETIFSDSVTVGSTTVTARNVETNELEEFSYDNPTALGALVEASKQAGFTYTLHYYPSWDSIILTSIENDAEWWHFYVDYDLPMVGISSFILSDENESLLFGYVDNFFVHALQIETSSNTIKKNENVTIKVKDENNEPIVNATIHLGDKEFISDEMGTVTITISQTGTFTLYAEKNLYIRSEKIDIQVEKTKTKGPDLFLRLFQETYICDLVETMIRYFFISLF